MLDRPRDPVLYIFPFGSLNSIILVLTGGGWGGLVPQRIKGLLYQSPIAQNGWNREGTPLLHRCCSCFCPACLLEVSDPLWSTWLVWSGSNIISNDLSSTNYRSENMSYNNPKEDPESRVPLHPLKINMTGWKITIFNRRYIFIHGCCCFSTVMLVFGGGRPVAQEFSFVLSVQPPTFQVLLLLSSHGKNHQQPWWLNSAPTIKHIDL